MRVFALFVFASGKEGGGGVTSHMKGWRSSNFELNP